MEETMRVAIFTPTKRPGLDVSYYSVKRQQTDAELIWFIGDSLYEERAQTIVQVCSELHNVDVKHYKPSYVEENPRGLALAYNEAMRMARAAEVDLFISLQDYIYIDSYGVEKFIYLASKAPDSLLTGLTHISADPHYDTIYSLDAPFTIFGQAYDKCPSEIAWEDVRYREGEGPFVRTIPIEWETNWAAIPKRALYDERLTFDEEYDKAVAYENQDYAFTATSRGYDIVMDFSNVAISLPHKKYFAREFAREEPLTEINKKLCETKWGL